MPETLLKLCEHEAAHAIFALLHAGNVLFISIGEEAHALGMSHGRVSWMPSRDLSIANLLEVTVSGACLDEMNGSSPEDLAAVMFADCSCTLDYVHQAGVEIDATVFDAASFKSFETTLAKIKASGALVGVIRSLGRDLEKLCVSGRLHLAGEELASVLAPYKTTLGV